MRKNKFIKLIEHILVALPILMIVATTCYTIFNANAKDSYSGIVETETQYVEVEHKSDFKVNERYRFAGSQLTQSVTLYISSSRFDVQELTYNNTTYTDCYFGFYGENSINQILYIRNLNDTEITHFSANGGTFEFVFVSTTISVNNYEKCSQWFYSIDTTYYNYLDKAFENSMSDFNNLGFNKINFTGFFEDIFFEGQPNVYLSFVNCYLNYMLLIECAFILPLVLYWFIHVGESILYRFEKGEW